MINFKNKKNKKKHKRNKKNKKIINYNKKKYKMNF